MFKKVLVCNILKTSLLKTSLLNGGIHMFYGRKEELEILNHRFNSDRFEFGFIYGQRRIGKTALIDEFSKSHKVLMFFAADSDDISIRNDFSNQLFAFTGEAGKSPFANWESFFLAIKESFKEEKVMIVFDEYPNIIVGHDGKRKKTDFDEKLQNAIDHLFKETPLTILIMGSNVSFMENIIKDGNGPLYKRHTFSLFVSKLKWNDALCFVKDMPLDDQIKTLSLTDTYPYYLSHLTSQKSFSDNLNAFFFNRDALITLDPSFVISSNINISGFYAGIMRCLSKGINTIKEIGVALNAESGKISLYLDELIKAGAVKKQTYFNSKRSTYYEINDRMTSFYFRFVQPYLEHIKLGNGLIIKEKERDAIDNFICRAYEKLCISYMQYLNSQGKLERYYLDFTNFRADNTSLKRSVEIDIIAEDKDFLLIGECKYSNHLKGINVYQDMQEDVLIKPLVDYPHKYFYIFSHAGFENNLLKVKDDYLHLISSKDMIII